MPPAARPILPVADLEEATAFFEGLGFAVTRYDDGYAWAARGNRELFHLRRVPGLDRDANRAGVYLHVADADEWHAAWLGGPAHLGAVEDRPWGMREFSFQDPSGNLIRVGHNL